MATRKAPAAPPTVADRALEEMSDASQMFCQLTSLFSAIEVVASTPNVKGLAQIGKQFACMAGQRLESEHDSFEKMRREGSSG